MVKTRLRTYIGIQVGAFFTESQETSFLLLLLCRDFIEFSVFPTGFVLHCRSKKRRGRSMRYYINNTLHSHLIYPQKPRPFGSSTACQKRFFLYVHTFFTIIKQLTAAEHRLSAVRTALFLLHPFLRMIRNSRNLYMLIKTTAEQEHHQIISLKSVSYTHLSLPLKQTVLVMIFY